MDAQVRLLCYPRGSFYPLSSVPPTKDRRITKTYFRTCLSRHSRSQAGLCFYTFSTMSIRTKPTFVSLRYLLARYRPSKTASLALSPPPFPGGMGEIYIDPKGGVSLLSGTLRYLTPSYAKQSARTNQYQATVKLHGVFLSWWNKAASSQPPQFRRAEARDSC